MLDFLIITTVANSVVNLALLLRRQCNSGTEKTEEVTELLRQQAMVIDRFEQNMKVQLARNRCKTADLNSKNDKKFSKSGRRLFFNQPA
jgi:hypothetical protein